MSDAAQQSSLASEAYSVVRTSSMARLRSGLGTTPDSMWENLTQITPGGLRAVV